MATETTAPAAAAAPPTSTWHFHIFYLVIILMLCFGGHEFIQEHDARMAAENQIKISQVTITDLQQQIVARDKQATAAQKVIVKVIHDVQTPAQAVSALPAVVTEPLPAPVTSNTSGDMIIPAADVVQIFDQLGDDKLCRSELVTASADLADTQAIVVQQTTEIKALKKKPSFWKRVKHDAKLIGIGTAIGGLVVLIH
jgi:hypothetical protein